MGCRCTIATLRLFIRNVAQIDLPNSRRPVSSHLSKINIRKLQTGSTTNGFANKSDTQEIASSSAKYEALSSYGGLRSELDQSDAVTDLSLESIDALAEELRSSQVEEVGRNEVEESLPDQVARPKKKAGGYLTPLQDILSDLPKQKEPVSKTAWRSIMDENDFSTSVPRSRPKLKFSASKSQGSKLDDDWEPPERKPWMIEKEKVKEKYPDGYQPLKKLSPDAIEGIRALHAQMPDRFPTFSLAQEFKVSPEAIRRILKSKWRPSTEEELDRERRWLNRGEKIWNRWAELGAKPPTRWRRMGVGAGIRPRRMRASSHEYTPDAPPQLVTTKAPVTGRSGTGGGVSASAPWKRLAIPLHCPRSDHGFSRGKTNLRGHGAMNITSQHPTTLITLPHLTTALTFPSVLLARFLSSIDLLDLPLFVFVGFHPYLPPTNKTIPFEEL